MNAALKLLAAAVIVAPVGALEDAVARWAGETSGGGVAEAIELAKADPTELVLPLVTARFCAGDFWYVHRAKEAMVAYGDRALPALVALLDDEREVKLTKTADLIYPGAEEFFGHGWVLPYDIDWIPTRAGWVIEEIAGESFGFLEEGEGFPRPDAFTAEQRAEKRRGAVKKAKEWWVDRTFFSSREDGFVPDAATAIKVAEAVWLPIYGTGIDDSRPFQAALEDGVWVVTGTLPEGMYGGVPHAYIRRHDGKVLQVFHTQ